MSDISNRLIELGNYLSGEIWFAAYSVGYFLAFGMNWANKAGLIGSIFYSLLSWINVGYHVQNSLRP